MIIIPTLNKESELAMFYRPGPWPVNIASVSNRECTEIEADGKNRHIHSLTRPNVRELIYALAEMMIRGLNENSF